MTVRGCAEIEVKVRQLIKWQVNVNCDRKLELLNVS